METTYIFRHDPNFKEVIYHYAFLELTKKYLTITKGYLWNLYKQLYKHNEDIVLTAEQFLTLLILFDKHNQRHDLFNSQFIKLLTMNINQNILSFYLRSDARTAAFIFERMSQGHFEADKSLKVVYENIVIEEDTAINHEYLDYFNVNREYLFLLTYDCVNDTDEPEKLTWLQEFISMLKEHNITDRNLIQNLLKIQFGFDDTSGKELVLLYLELSKSVPSVFLLDIFNRMTGGLSTFDTYDKIIADYGLGLYHPRHSKLEQKLQPEQVLKLRRKAIKLIKSAEDDE